MWEMGYLTVLHVRLGAKIGDRHAKDSNAFRKRLMVRTGVVARRGHGKTWRGQKV